MIIVTCADCSLEQHRASNGARPDYQALLPCVDAKCPRKAVTPDEDYQLNLNHIREISHAS